MMNKKILVAAVVVYALALSSLVAMYYKSYSSVQFYDSLLAGYSQPLPALSSPAENAESGSQLIMTQIQEMNSVLTRRPTNLEAGYELLELAKKHNLEIISLASSDRRQTVIKSAYYLQSFNMIVIGSQQDLINLLGDLQEFRPGSLVIDSVRLIPAKTAFQSNIFFTIYSRER